MPQLEFASYASQIFWLAITFGVLYIILARYILPSIREVLQSRQSRISSDLKKAEKLKNEAKEAEDDFTSSLSGAKQKASSLIFEARKKADDEAVSRHAKLDESFARQAKESEQRINLLKEDAFNKFIPVAANTAALMLEKLINVKVSQKEAEQAVKNYIE